MNCFSSTNFFLFYPVFMATKSFFLLFIEIKMEKIEMAKKWRHNIQHNAIQHNDTRHDYKKQDTSISDN
jgi:hypothetical protein